ncbi:hypothetical protein [Clostridium sp. HBUAS56010]|uniref:hypothetical protein n=1 Tax=Clostridium sp. HBUAS56010 TaxID=2571127 RepID=UPI001177EFEB|nr:hypothetical protein [Clostridium sp. HBUAS56010]
MANIQLKNLDSFLLKQVVNKYKELQIKLPEYLKEFIYSEFYNKYTPSDLYDRQYRIIDAIMVSNIKVSGVTVSMEIYLDPDKASYDPSTWKNPITRTVSEIPGDTVEDVWELMRNGVHGQESIAVTDGDFWQAFVDSVNRGGMYDLFQDFKKYLSSTVGISIK